MWFFSISVYQVQVVLLQCQSTTTDRMEASSLVGARFCPTLSARLLRSMFKRPCRRNRVSLVVSRLSCQTSPNARLFQARIDIMPKPESQRQSHLVFLAVHSALREFLDLDASSNRNLVTASIRVGRITVLLLTVFVLVFLVIFISSSHRFQSCDLLLLSALFLLERL